MLVCFYCFIRYIPFVICVIKRSSGVISLVSVHCVIQSINEFSTRIHIHQSKKSFIECAQHFSLLIIVVFFFYYFILKLIAHFTCVYVCVADCGFHYVFTFVPVELSSVQYLYNIRHPFYN